MANREGMVLTEEEKKELHNVLIDSDAESDDDGDSGNESDDEDGSGSRATVLLEAQLEEQLKKPTGFFGTLFGRKGKDKQKSRNDKAQQRAHNRSMRKSLKKGSKINRSLTPSQRKSAAINSAEMKAGNPASSSMGRVQGHQRAQSYGGNVADEMIANRLSDTEGSSCTTSDEETGSMGSYSKAKGRSHTGTPTQLATPTRKALSAHDPGAQRAKSLSSAQTQAVRSPRSVQDPSLFRNGRPKSSVSPSPSPPASPKSGLRRSCSASSNATMAISPRDSFDGDAKAVDPKVDSKKARHISAAVEAWASPRVDAPDANRKSRTVDGRRASAKMNKGSRGRKDKVSKLTQSKEGNSAHFSSSPALNSSTTSSSNSAPSSSLSSPAASPTVQPASAGDDEEEEERAVPKRSVIGMFGAPDPATEGLSAPTTMAPPSRRPASGVLDAPAIAVSPPVGAAGVRTARGEPKGGRTIELKGRTIELLEMLGKGATANVWKAEIDGRMVALKQISLEGAKDKRQLRVMLKEEVEMMKKLQHPNVIQYYGFFYTSKTQTINLVLEIVEGFPFRQFVVRYKDFTEKLVAHVMQQCLLGLSFLHQNNIIHRDLKPDNMLVTTSGVIKLIDFGTATKVIEIKTCRRSTVGTPWYTAPEVINAEEYSYAADIWSLGCSLVEFITGKPPYSDMNQIAALFKMAEETPPFPPNLSPECHDFLDKCWQREWKKRPTAKELLNHPFIMKYRYEKLEENEVGYFLAKIQSDYDKMIAESKA
eukprot:TRINITY_DN1496_c1_g3_i1.p1 TRINITY_DN1496_c1_g3~~TRINITY_DN1496_c1_g3_i1.p1  ORF type:complete len:763 (+),score=229.93 TRINITY_DN1496_c1_g3_i1:219-2507(+)